MFVWSIRGDFSGPLATSCTQPELRYYVAELESSGFVYSKTTPALGRRASMAKLLKTQTPYWWLTTQLRWSQSFSLNPLALWIYIQTKICLHSVQLSYLRSWLYMPVYLLKSLELNDCALKSFKLILTGTTHLSTTLAYSIEVLWAYIDWHNACI